MKLLSTLPPIRGRYRENADLSKTSWFQVGGAAEVLFRPEDAADLAHFLREVPREIPLTIIGATSNLLVRDGGIPGVTIRLGRGFAGVEFPPLPLGEGRGEGKYTESNSPHPALRATLSQGERVIIAGAACLDAQVADFAAANGCAGLEFLSGIPGCIGGALAMNGGAYGGDVAGVLLWAEALDGQGNLHRFSVEEMEYSYRHCGLVESRVASRESCNNASATRPESHDSNHASYIFTRAAFRVVPGDREMIMQQLAEIKTRRESTQPIRSKTGGSTFKNPPGMKAWELIDVAGCRGLRVGGAMVSEQHCNFLINTGGATAADLENLGEEVRARVLAKTGVELEWEIKRVGVSS